VAELVPIAGTGATAKIRSPLAVAIFVLITLGIYSWFYWYFINREMRDYGRAKGTDELGTSPGTSVLAVTLGALIIVPAIVSIVRTFGRVQKTQRLAGETPLNGWIALILIIVISPAFYAYLQSGLNGAWRAQAS
jgi:small-conductance mechanosensitive channel